MFKKIVDKNRYYNKILVFIFIIAMLFTLISLAISDVNVKKINENGNEYLYYELYHNLTDTAYKYYGYGYTVTVYDNYGKEIGSDFITNAEFQPIQNGSTETVKIAIETIYDIMGVPNKYYYRDNCKIWLNGRLGIKVNGSLTFLYDSLDGSPETGIDNLETGNADAYTGKTTQKGIIPLNKNGKGIRNGIENEYGVSWSATTKINLKQHFGINYTLKPVNAFDGYEVLYKEEGTDRIVSSEKELQNFGETREIKEKPISVNGYEYSGSYKIEKTDSKGNTSTFKDKTKGDSATVNLAKTSSIYTITFYYNKYIPPSQGGELRPVEIEVYYQDEQGNTLAPMETYQMNMYDRFTTNSKKIDGYTVQGYFGLGKEKEWFYDNYVDIILTPDLFK